jgi:hypothetical protein
MGWGGEQEERQAAGCQKIKAQIVRSR